MKNLHAVLAPLGGIFWLHKHTIYNTTWNYIIFPQPFVGQEKPHVTQQIKIEVVKTLCKTMLE